MYLKSSIDNVPRILYEVKSMCISNHILEIKLTRWNWIIQDGKMTFKESTHLVSCELSIPG